MSTERERERESSVRRSLLSNSIEGRKKTLKEIAEIVYIYISVGKYRTYRKRVYFSPDRLVDIIRTHPDKAEVDTFDGFP